jgi:hypothetical protein
MPPITLSQLRAWAEEIRQSLAELRRACDARVKRDPTREPEISLEFLSAKSSLSKSLVLAEKKIKARESLVRYRCTLCMRDCEESTCDKCGQSHKIHRKGMDHAHEWSRRTIDSMECKACQKIISLEAYERGGV